MLAFNVISERRYPSKLTLRHFKELIDGLTRLLYRSSAIPRSELYSSGAGSEATGREPENILTVPFYNAVRKTSNPASNTLIVVLICSVLVLTRHNTVPIQFLSLSMVPSKNQCIIA